jgi:hypothetical protein
MGRWVVHADPMAFSLKDCPLKFAAARRPGGAETVQTAK